jgi:hypothetical protein
MSERHDLLCPSAPHDMEGARVFAVVGGTVQSPEVSYLDEPVPVTQEIIDMAGPVSPDEVFRIAGSCGKGACAHYAMDSDQCTLAQRTVAMAPAAVHLLPRCAIRLDCVWWSQEGASACRRCPQVTTRDYAADDLTRVMAQPPQGLSVSD